VASAFRYSRTPPGRKGAPREATYSQDSGLEAYEDKMDRLILDRRLRPSEMGDVLTEVVCFDTSETSEEVDRRGALRCLRMR
jgi:hypothetical protein